MTDRPDALDAAAAASLGDGAYPESQVAYRGATYWLERSADGTKRLVAVADDESAFDGFTGCVESLDGASRWWRRPPPRTPRPSVRRCPG